MSIDWTHFTSAAKNVKEVLAPGYRYAPYEEIGGKTAADVLKQVDKILQSTNTVLENHKEYMPASQFSELKKAYCRYHWQMTNESQEDRAYYDQRIRESRILSQLYADRATHHDRAKLLLREVETYQTRVLSASRNAQPPQLLKFEDELTESATGAEHSALESYTSWLSLIGRTSRPSSIDNEVEQAQPDPAAAHNAEWNGFIVSVTHFPKSPGESINIEDSASVVVGSGNKIYRRMVAFENNEKRVEIKDRRLYALKENETYVAETALQAMLELGERLLSESDSAITQISGTTDSPSQTPSLETTIQKFRKTSVPTV
ncbi:hypothetical protein RSOLAG22IIIB_10386 [Rhizoctonia solani]|uniref:Uncharacterized protein n=1 Tax=Rhizoctonia solani TaxID=456999 RepID=A0A0K6G340_9AGAM|nr:hypothetical protein RSOLAG22IIIB_10386 [Rhizoctonia solani]